ncbi:MAG: efflux RND transporter periplasmic adaptor subunit [Patescibacteria group bacterium]|nr:efflux RND transporter periplasmic adaptor subunit [Patescibacteria group bacterium]
MKKFLGLIMKHKIRTLIILAVVVFGGYYGWQKFFLAAMPVRYVIVKAERGVLISSITGTGQVSASNQVDIKAKTSGDVVSINTKIGQEVKAGALLLSLSARDALKTVRDAEANLDSAKISLFKLTEAADPLTLLQYENSLAQAEESKRQYEDNLNKAYEDGFTSVSNAFLDMPAVISGLNSMIYGNNFEANQSNLDYYANRGSGSGEADRIKVTGYRDNLDASYKIARASFDIVFDDYKSASRASSSSTVDALVADVYEMTKLVADTVKNFKNFLDYVQDMIEQSPSRTVTVPTLMTTHQNTLETYTGTTNSHLSGLLSAKQTISNTKNQIINADRSIAEKIISLADLKAGTDPLDLRSAQLTVEQRENSLLDAREKLADYYVRAPFDGVVAAFTPKKGDPISSGASLGTLITKQRIATVALNEIDVAKVKTGQKATITFDAIDGLSITGEVAEIDTIGTVSQGVVSYNVKIGFDVQDDRIKPGMSVTVNIILNSKPDVLMISTSAIKTQNGASYVEVMASGTPQKTPITTGDSNDTMTEVVSGLNEGDEVVTQTVTGATTAGVGAAAQSTNRVQGGMMFGGPRD